MIRPGKEPATGRRRTSLPTVTALAGPIRAAGCGDGATEPSGDGEITVETLDRAALVALFESTDGLNWVNRENWLTDVPLGGWYGVDTDASGRVVRLGLRGQYDAEANAWMRLGLAGPSQRPRSRDRRRRGQRSERTHSGQGSPLSRETRPSHG